MTFLEAALQILRRERRPLHYKEITERAIGKNLLTFVGRTPEVTMQTQLTQAVKKAPGNPFVRVKPGVFGLLRYPETVEPEEITPPVVVEKPAAQRREASASGENGQRAAVATGGGAAGSAASAAEDRNGRRRRRGRRGRGRADGTEAVGEAGAEAGAVAAAPAAPRRRVAAAVDVLGEEAELQNDPAHDGDEGDEPETTSLSAEDRAAALAESMGEAEAEGVDDEDDVDGDDDGEDDEVTEEVRSGSDQDAPAARDGQSRPPRNEARARGGESAAAAGEELESREGDAQGDADSENSEEGDGPEEAGAAGEAGEGGEAGGRRRRRRRRRRRGAGPENGAAEPGFGPAAPTEAGDKPSPAIAASDGADGEASGSEGESPAVSGDSAGAPQSTTGSDSQQGRRIMTPVDAAIEILRAQPPGRGVHVRQIADAAVRRRLIHGEPHEAWRVLRAALAAEPRERLRAGVRPRVRPAGSGLFALARRPPDADLERSEQVFGEARRALKERTLAALEQKLTELSPGAFEALARVLLQREGFGPATFIKRVEGTVYLETLRGRGFRPSKCLVALRSGGPTAGRRSIGELRAGVKARNQDEGLIVLAARLGDDAVSEWKQPGPPVEVVDGPALAEACVRHGVGVISTQVAIDFVDADFFAELTEG